MSDADAVLSGTLDRTVADGGTRLAARGAWVIDTAEALDEVAEQATRNASGPVVVDLSGVTHIDTAGAWLITRIAGALTASGIPVEMVGMSDNARRLIAAVESVRHPPLVQPRQRFILVQLLEALGRSTINARNDIVQALSILGGVVKGILRSIARPSRFRFTSIVFHLDRSGLQAVPIIALISLLIGGIVAQQGVFQLSFFGAEDFVVDLVGILVLRELGVLLTAIMLAGRSGSAYTAEIGSMKMREELDALQVIGLDPLETLIMPRILALVIALPLLTFISDIFGLVGGALVSFIYGDMTFQRFILLLRDAVDMSTLMVGLIKAPFMGLIVGLIAANEGLNVEGSSESLGRRTTSSVVKAIFMVIVADGLFAIFFAAIDY
ncbi:MAG: MlaE family lipid ABC transporter permease subunit [Bauldia sp.]|nr:MlaE family lipid ABC transporter permease subunit [Bauldia sp.]